ncbi:MAG: hypothetical protein FGM52_11570 [Mycobacterium sp.]|nr:hypothetical protein [Mycobacterium sp.]
MITVRRRLRVRPVTWVGLVIAAVGSAPLLAVIAASKIGWLEDPNPNPVGLGILAALTFWPGLALAGAGLVWSVIDARRGRPGH